MSKQAAVPVRTYAIGRYKPDGTMITKRKRVVTKPYRTKRVKYLEKRREVKRSLAFIFTAILICAGYGVITSSNIDIRAEAQGIDSTDVTVEESIPEATPVDYSNIPYISKIEPSVEEQIRMIAAEKNFQWPDYLVRLANCESKLNPKNSNIKGNTPAGSVDRGLFQINSYWHREVSDECAYDIRCATEWTIKMIEEGKQGQWVCDTIIN